MKDKLIKLINDRSSSESIDRAFGLVIEENESHFKTSENFAYQGLQTEAWLTSYLDFYQISEYFNFSKDQTFIDLGSGYSRAALLFSVLFPQLKTISLEKVKQRVLYTKEILQKNKLNAEIKCHDLLRDDLPIGDYYFFYMPGGEILLSILEKLFSIASQKNIYFICIESHGDTIEQVKNFAPWLTLESNKIQSVSERWQPRIHIFKSLSINEMVKFHQKRSNLIGKLDFSDLQAEDIFYLLIKSRKENLQIIVKDKFFNSEETYLWLGDIKEWEYCYGEIQLQNPPRKIRIDQIQGLLEPKQEIKQLCSLRNKKEFYDNLGEIRKIIISPEIRVEFSKGKRLSLENIPFL